jgi:universal stress protein A
MKSYKHILLAVDLHPACNGPVASRAVEIAKDFGSTLSVVHAIEHLNAYGVAQAYPTVIDLEEQMVKEAADELAKWGKRYGVPPDNQHVKIGSPKSVILDLAKTINVDLVVVGSHGRHGIGILLGSTANAVLHNAGCDVLAVRV